MPKSKKQGIALSIIMTLIMIYVMAALNLDVRDHSFRTVNWMIALKRLPLGFIVGICCDLLVCTPTSRKIVSKVCKQSDQEQLKVFVLRFSMVVLMTVAMTIFSCLVSGKIGMSGIKDFFTYLPYNFTIALPIQMLIVAPLSYRLSKSFA